MSPFDHVSYSDVVRYADYFVLLWKQDCMHFIWVDQIGGNLKLRVWAHSRTLWEQMLFCRIGGPRSILHCRGLTPRFFITKASVLPLDPRLYFWGKGREQLGEINPEHLKASPGFPLTQYQLSANPQTGSCATLPTNWQLKMRDLASYPQTWSWGTHFPLAHKCLTLDQNGSCVEMSDNFISTSSFKKVSKNTFP